MKEREYLEMVHDSWIGRRREVQLEMVNGTRSAIRNVNWTG